MIQQGKQGHSYIQSGVQLTGISEWAEWWWWRVNRRVRWILRCKILKRVQISSYPIFHNRLFCHKFPGNEGQLSATVYLLLSMLTPTTSMAKFVRWLQEHSTMLSRLCNIVHPSVVQSPRPPIILRNIDSQLFPFKLPIYFSNLTCKLKVPRDTVHWWEILRVKFTIGAYTGNVWTLTILPRFGSSTVAPL